VAKYIAVVHKEPDSIFGVSFPDFPGCVAGGETLQDAHDSANEALELHIQGMIEDGDPIPKPCSFEEAQEHVSSHEAVAFLLVEIDGPEIPLKRVNVMFPANTIAALDREAARLKTSRSRVLVDIVAKSFKDRRELED
jgi:predicted RNase H-like HicB family nuclease